MTTSNPIARITQTRPASQRKSTAITPILMIDVLIRKGIRTRECFAALDAEPTFFEICQESISNHIGIHNKHERR